MAPNIFGGHCSGGNFFCMSARIYRAAAAPISDLVLGVRIYRSTSDPIFDQADESQGLSGNLKVYLATRGSRG